MPSGNLVYEVVSFGQTYVVHLGNKSCDCRAWQVSGIPCRHVIACCT